MHIHYNNMTRRDSSLFSVLCSLPSYLQSIFDLRLWTLESVVSVLYYCSKYIITLSDDYYYYCLYLLHYCPAEVCTITT